MSPKSPSAAFSPVILSVLFALLAGCARYGGGPVVPPGTATPKRVALHDSVDYLYRCRAKAYKHQTIHNPRAADKADTLSVYGQPDYVRIPFRSQYGEKTEEWLYIGQDRVFQFVKNNLVYSGPVSDLERILLRKGYPKYAFQSQPGKIPLQQTLVYRNWQGTDVEVYCLTDGWMVVGGE
jgi:hypothetical protein